ncbi:LysR family transcriptional regulator [Ramlibacter sp. AW1]|uniref:LysR family transcriptional regulator n=1 Tax=Ramlibacter aurantiacus TaxID=2801330 RepID=A0A936ZR85_9BURK|nr:LysR family transcriptional regulator [Ramlibacter aurantiacus]MBL0421046.1 LysR family transcriptional regulator [Ramlibacter aurantiacus]
MGDKLIGRIDLDGLQVFDAVMREGSVTRAADSLALTQSAVSHALARLRLILKDPLFVRTAGGVKPTPRAINLWDEVQDALQVLRRAVLPGEFDPFTARGTITLAVNDMIAQLLMPKLVQQLQDQAPHLRLSMPMRTFGESELRLEQGTLDFGLGLFYALQPSLRRRSLWTDDYVCLCRRGHPALAKPWTLEAFQAVHQVGVSPNGDLFTYADGALRYAGIERTVTILVSHFSCVPPMLQGTDLMALMPRFYAGAVADHYGLALLDPPFTLSPVKYELVWHERSERVASHVWLREQLVTALGRTEP